MQGCETDHDAQNQVKLSRRPSTATFDYRNNTRFNAFLVFEFAALSRVSALVQVLCPSQNNLRLLPLHLSFFANCPSIHSTLFLLRVQSQRVTRLSFITAVIHSVIQSFIQIHILDFLQTSFQRVDIYDPAKTDSAKGLTSTFVKMYSSQFLSSALTLLAAAIPSVVGQYYNPVCAYFVQYTGGYLVSERVDPLLSAGVASNHVHSIAGGNGFKANMKFADTQASTCTTAQVTQDKSNYWMPVLYFNHGGKFYKVPEADDRKFYYKFGNGDCSYDQERSEFPPEFRMITGSALQREQNDTMMGSGGSQLEWVCHDGANNPKGTAGGFPTGFQSCNQPYVRGLTATMRFPSCWNGNDFDHANPLAHMAFPINKDGMAGCLAPFNHKRFPEIMIEFYFDIKSFDHITKDYSDPNNPPWVLANGDPFGYSFHLDFVCSFRIIILVVELSVCN